VRKVRVIIVLLLLGVGLWGAYFGVRGQGPRLPWPSPPVTPPDHYEKSEPPQRTSQAPPPEPRPVTETAPSRPIVPASLVTQTPAGSPMPAASPIQVELTAPAPTPFVPPTETKVDTAPVLLTESQPAPMPPAAPVNLDPAPKASSNAPSLPAPPEPIVKAAADERVNEPVIILPRVDPEPADAVSPPLPKALPAPVAAPTDLATDRSKATAIQASPPAAVPADLKTVSYSAQALVPEAAPVQPPVAMPLPTRPRAFQLVNPIRREDIPPVAPLDPAPLPERPLIQAQPVAKTNQLPPTPPTGTATTGNTALGSPLNTTPSITIEKRGPAIARAGGRLPFTIILRNVGSSPAMQVRVEDEIPIGARVISSEPQAALQGDRAAWVIPTLPPGAEKQLKLDLEARDGTEIVGNASVWVSATSTVRIRQISNPLAIAVKPAAAVPVGFPVVFEVQVTNHSQQTLTGMVLHARLPAGLTHPAGKEIEADVGDLAPGASKPYKMPLTAAKPGQHVVDVKISAPGGLEAHGQATVQITQGAGAGLTVQQPASVKLFLNKETELRIDVTNRQTQGLKNVTVLDSLPDGVEFIAASDRGLFRPDARVAYWLIDYLAPGQTKTLALRVQPKVPGHYANNVTARTEAQQETQSSAQIQVQGISDLAIKVIDRDSPIEVGKAAVYEIKVTNQGSAAATGVQVQATLSEGMALTQARGPTQHRLEGRQVFFASLPNLQPQGQAVYYVTALAQTPGDQRCRVQLVSDQTAAPIAREERSFVYRD
jgi:uncharacterized repeat protein (TIGR01451 family)